MRYAGLSAAGTARVDNFQLPTPKFLCFYEKFALLLGKLMILSKGWLRPDDIAMPVAQLWEKAVDSTPPTPTWLPGNFMKGGFFP